MRFSRQGEIIADLLHGAWRAVPPSSVVDVEQLHMVAPLLPAAGTAPLVWNRLCALHDPATVEEAESLHTHFRLTELHAQLQAAAIDNVAACLTGDGIDALLIKGYALASRCYASPGLRPVGDIDIAVSVDDYFAAADSLNEICHHDQDKSRAPGRLQTLLYLDSDIPLSISQIDLHRGLERYGSASHADLYGRGIDIELDQGRRVRTLCDEDHLRLLCLHFLKHGGWKPVWLCDIAAMIESIDDDFQWDICDEGDPAVRRQVDVVCRLAVDLLGASPPATARRLLREKAPRWMREAILARWGEPFHRHRHRPRVIRTLKHAPGSLLSDIAARWPDPVTAASWANARFDGKYLPFLQLAQFTHRIVDFIARGGRA